MRKFLFTLTCLVCFTLTVSAQNRTVTGRVTDEKGIPVSGASIIVQGTNIGTATKADGTYLISVPSNNSNLIFSSVNYTSEIVKLGGKRSINVSLNGSTANLAEIVVTGYGGTKKKDFTGTATTIGTEKIKDLQVSSVTNLLQGQASGVVAVNSNGQPGTNATIRIRGIGSITQPADPLILLDGAQYGGNLNSINPNDIESITILKDASSTSIYGSRAANGIIQITTKLGKGTPKISFSAVAGQSTRAVNDYQYTNSQQLYELTWQALKNEADVNPSLISSTGSASAQDYASKSVANILVYNPFGVANPIGLDGKLVSNAQNLWNEDWSNQLLRTGQRQDYNISISGGNEKTRYFISGQYLNDNGIVKDSYFKRYGTRIKVDTKVTDWLTTGFNTNISYSDQSYPAQGGSSYSNAIGWIRSASSIFPAYLVNPTNGQFILDASGNKIFDYGNNGSLTRPYGAGSNALGAIELNNTDYNRFVTSIIGYGEAKITKDLKFKTQYALDYYMYAANQYYNPFLGDGSAYGGRSDKIRDINSTQTFTNTLTYDKKFGIHHINILAGMEAFRFNYQHVEAENRGFTFPGLTELDYGSSPTTSSSNSDNQRLVSYFGRLNYDLNDKYHISLSARTDGSTRFADSVRWGSFYSVGGSWNLNKENFFNIKPINDLKLRASYGTSGNQFTNASFPYLGLYSAGWNIGNNSGAVISSVTNGNLTWEKQKILDLGLDFGLFKNRIVGSVTYFKRESKGLLYDIPLPPSGGVNTVTANVGALRNDGVELDLTTRNVVGKNFTWTTSLNYSKINNKIISLPTDSIVDGSYIRIIGQPLYSFYTREYAGVDAADGRPLWYQDIIDGTGKVTGKTVTKNYTAGSRYNVGTALPKWTGGITNSFTYKSFDLSVLISISVGGKIYDADYAGLMHSSVGLNPGTNWSTDILNSWKSSSDIGDGKTPRLTQTTDDQGTNYSTRFLYDASYARIRNITLGYNFSRELLNNTKISGARFFIDLQNPFTIFGRKGLDPEEGIGGITSNTSAVYKTISVGVDINL